MKERLTLREGALLLICIVCLCSLVWNWYNPKVIEKPIPGKTEYRDITKWKDKIVYVKVTSKSNNIISYKTSTIYKDNGICPTYYECPVYDESECMVIALENDFIDGLPVTARGKCPNSNTSYEIASTITPSTGETTLFIKPNPRPFFAFENDKEIGLRYGIKPEVDIFVRYTFFRAGSLYASLYGEANLIDANISGNAMIETSYRW